MSYQIFISYRREGGETLAKNISDKLKERGLKKTFYDVESLRSGKFNEKIFSVIDSCSDVVVVLPPNALDRCVNDDDWVRQEIAYAIKKGKNIIPVLMRGFEFPDNLPEDIAELRNYNGLTANMEYFDASVEKLLSMLDSYRKKMRIKKVLIALTVAVVSVCVALGAYFVTSNLQLSAKQEPNGANTSLSGEQDLNVQQTDIVAPYFSLSAPEFNTGLVEFTVSVIEDSEFVSIYLNEDTVETIGFTADLEVVDQGRIQILKFTDLQVHSEECQINLLGGAAKDAANNESASCSSSSFYIDTTQPDMTIGPKEKGKIIKEGDSAVYNVAFSDNSGIMAVNITKEDIIMHGFVADVSIKKVSGGSGVVTEITFSNIKFNDFSSKYFEITEGVAADCYGNLNTSSRMYLKTK